MKICDVKREKGVILLGGLTLILAFVLIVMVPLSSFGEDKIAKEKADVRKMARETLARLYKSQPSAKKAVERAAGYAVFSNFGMKIFVAGGGSGKGIAFSNSTKKETFMKMVEVQAGLGMGIKKFRLVWVFENSKDLDGFINSGWELGGQATAAAKAGGQGGAFAGAMSIAPGVWLYQLTDDGLALELTAKGTKYYKDDKLN
jgi:lipid-binding SYLF domain-containing protein